MDVKPLFTLEGAMNQKASYIFVNYWHAYQGATTLLLSPYLYAAIVVDALTWGTWSGPYWWNTVLLVLPNLLGFALGGFAMFLGFGDDKFGALLVENDDSKPEDSSLYINLCATFVHFIVIQIGALLYALVAKSCWFYYHWSTPMRALLVPMNLLGGALGYGLFLYSITSILAATMHMFRTAAWYEKHQVKQKQKTRKW
jgi:hypothetical protein